MGQKNGILGVNPPLFMRKTTLPFSMSLAARSATPSVLLSSTPSVTLSAFPSAMPSATPSAQASALPTALLAAVLIVLLAFGGLLGLGGCTTGLSPAQPSDLSSIQTKVAIIHTNDIHGYFMSAEPTESSPGVMGLAALAQLKKDYEDQGYEVLLLDDGDATQDNVLVNLSQGESAIKFMNYVGYDAMSLGNHEFDWGVDNLQKLIGSADFPVLAANIIIDANAQTFTQAHTIIELNDGSKVGIFGMTTPETKTKTSPRNTAGLNFLTGYDLSRCAQQQIDALRAEGCAMVICLGHLGSIGAISPNRSINILENTEGIDLFIDGHDHEVITDVVNGTLLVSTGSHLENIGVVLLEEGVLSDQMLTYGSYEGRDAAAESLVAQVYAEVSDQLSEVIGSTAVPLNGQREPGVRTEETNLGNFAADAMLWQATQASDDSVDAAIVNGGNIRASIDVGDISMATLMTVFPYNNALNVVTLSGAELLEVLESATFSLPEAAGSFPQVAGITYSVDTTVPYQNGEQYPDSTFFAPAAPGARVTISDVGGRGFALDERYAIAVSSFITAGGDTFFAVALAYQETGYSTGYSDTDALINFLKTELKGVIGEEYRAPKGHITIQ